MLIRLRKHQDAAALIRGDITDQCRDASDELNVGENKLDLIASCCRRYFL